MAAEDRRSSSRAEEGPIDVRILGPLEVAGGTGPVALPRGRGRALLALLALRAGEVVTADRIVDELWGPTPPRTAIKGLHNLISDLRRRLGDGGSGRASVLATSGPGYVLRIHPDQVDANRFRRLLEEAAGAPAEARAAQLRTALGLWRGPALADFVYDPFAQTEIAVLEDLRLAATEERIDADLVLGRHAELVGELEKLVLGHPFRERLRAQLMLALYRCGRQADALEVFRAGRRALVEELGIEPGSTLSGLERAILAQDPSLDPARPEMAVEPSPARRPWPAAERKTVTVVCVELEESSATAADADPEALRRLHADCVEAATGTLERHGGTVQGPIGGVVVAVFGVPTAREDDALRAARAAVELRRAVAAPPAGAAPQGSVRMVARAGLGTGEVVVGGPAMGPQAASGDVVRLATRLQRAADEAEVLVDEATRRLLGDAVRVESVASLVLDRRGRPVTVWRLVEVIPGAAARAPDRSRPLVGRSGELARLHAALQRTRRRRRCSRLTIVGEPGVGKSRLALEFVEGVDAQVRVLRSRCPASGEGITFWPLRELVLQAVGERGLAGIAALLAGQDDADAVAAQVAGATGLGDEPAAGAELFPAVRRLFETLARDRPTVLVVDDVHWAQPTLLDLVDYLAESVERPLLIVCLARPELLDARPEWIAGADEPTSIALAPLSPSDSERLVAQRLAGRLVSDEIAAQVVDMAQGNPLYIEQLLAALRDEGKLEFPASVHALLAARLDRLGPAERELLRCASVIGSEFSQEALTVVVPEPARRSLDRHLYTLERKEFIRPARRAFLEGRAFTFRHVLVQQAAYRSATRELRAELHERLADWLEQREDPESDEVIAYHLEQACGQRRQLGLEDDTTRELAVRAGVRLARSGLRAYRLFDMTAAENLLSRSRALLPGDHPRRHEVLRRLSQAYPTLGRLREAEAVLAELLEDPRSRGDHRVGQRLRLERLRVRLIAGPDPIRHDVIRREVEQALGVLEPVGDDVGISQACYLLATMHLRSGRIRDLEAVARRGLDHARRSGDLREVLGALWWPSWALAAGPTPVDDAVAACEGLLCDGPGEHPGVLSDLARLKAMRGELGGARGLVARARRQIVERVRVRRPLTVLAHRSAEVEIRAGDLGAAERVLRAGVEVALDIGERDQTSQLAAELSRVLSARGAADEAATYADLGRQHAPSESVAAQALWRAARARLLALGGQAPAGEALAREAVALVPADMLNLRADLSLDLAEVLLAGGLEGQAAAARDAARGLYERKGNLLGARRCG